jgi:hypothetical protein
MNVTTYKALAWAKVALEGTLSLEETEMMLERVKEEMTFINKNRKTHIVTTKCKHGIRVEEFCEKCDEEWQKKYECCKKCNEEFEKETK